jgi:hypothetical protein
MTIFAGGDSHARARKTDRPSRKTGDSAPSSKCRHLRHVSSERRRNVVAWALISVVSGAAIAFGVCDPQSHRVYFPLESLHGRAVLRIMEDSRERITEPDQVREDGLHPVQ